METYPLEAISRISNQTQRQSGASHASRHFPTLKKMESRPLSPKKLPSLPPLRQPLTDTTPDVFAKGKLPPLKKPPQERVETSHSTETSEGSIKETKKSDESIKETDTHDSESIQPVSAPVSLIIDIPTPAELELLEHLGAGSQESSLKTESPLEETPQDAKLDATQEKQHHSEPLMTEKQADKKQGLASLEIKGRRQKSASPIQTEPPVSQRSKSVSAQPTRDSSFLKFFKKAPASPVSLVSPVSPVTLLASPTEPVDPSKLAKLEIKPPRKSVTKT
ncbi:hypothetical protein EDD86DRAFT_3059 [Gorgonomyces haynaldii]|nr:hypothetical protein EDD86DRAFT_3059 [Gorgonomyces haynaldii]